MIDRIDHFVLTVASIAETCAFYERALGLQRIDTEGGRVALGFGRQKINLHQRGSEFSPRAQTALLGTGDFCLIASVPMADLTRRLAAAGVAIELGPVARNGAAGPMESVYFRDPDRNLVEVSVYD